MKISQEELTGRFDKGWQVEEVVKAKPKKKPKPLIKEQVVEGIQQSTELTNKSIVEMVDAMRTLFSEQVKITSEFNDKLMQINDRKITVEMPERKQTAEKKKRWKFSVKRDGRGFIEDIIAEEI